MFAKVAVNGAKAHPVWSYMKEQRGELLGNDIKWNFAKFLIDPSGNVVKRYGPQQGPASIEKDIVPLLSKVKVSEGVVKTTSPSASVEDPP
mmetsp:Transcript_10344/g.20904  ORF Transcript_10344/g.20904 Transcript_10344/m.20904 type:complete len:91 (+) Transcript_10344:302-574(+)